MPETGSGANDPEGRLPSRSTSKRGWTRKNPVPVGVSLEQTFAITSPNGPDRGQGSPDPDPIDTVRVGPQLGSAQGIFNHPGPPRVLLMTRTVSY